jgi:hypothetical protein
MTGSVPGRARAVRHVLSVVAMASMLSLGFAPYAGVLAREEGHRCTCCPRGRCKCHEETAKAGGGPSFLPRSICRSGCGCVGVLTSLVQVLGCPSPARDSAVGGAGILLAALPGAGPTAAPLDPLHQRPPPCLPA